MPGSLAIRSRFGAGGIVAMRETLLIFGVGFCGKKHMAQVLSQQGKNLRQRSCFN